MILLYSGAILSLLAVTIELFQSSPNIVVLLVGIANIGVSSWMIGETHK